MTELHVEAPGVIRVSGATANQVTLTRDQYVAAQKIRFNGHLERKAEAIWDASKHSCVNCGATAEISMAYGHVCGDCHD